MATDIGVDLFDRLDRTVPMDRISAEARQVSFRRGLLAVIAALLVGIGWSVAKAARMLLSTAGVALVGAGWVAAKSVLAARAGSAWCAAAVKVGWQEGYGPARRAD
jgi:hypothetical protein